MALQSWNIDTAHSGIHFSVRHLVISKVRGAFTQFRGTLQLDEQNWSTASVAVHIDAASIDTREPKRDDHLRSADFFDVAKYPELTFQSTRVEQDGEDLKVVGNLTLHGITREVVLNTEFAGQGTDPWGNKKIAFNAKTTVNRKDFDLGWNQVLEAGGVLVGEKVEIELDIQAVPA